MRRISALLCVAGLATAPASVAAGPSRDPWTPARPRTVEKLEWSSAKARLGVMVMSLTPELRKHFGAPEDRGVLVAHVEPGTPAASAGIEVGDVIVGVRGQKIDAAFDVISALDELGKGEHARVDVVRDGTSRTLDATLASPGAPHLTWSLPWLRDWMSAFDEHRGFGPPFFDGPAWHHDELRVTPAKPDTVAGTSFLDSLRELFAPKSGPACQRS